MSAPKKIHGKTRDGREFTISSDKPPERGSASEIGPELRAGDLEVGQVVILLRNNLGITANVFGVSDVGVSFATPRGSTPLLVLQRAHDGTLHDEKGRVAVHRYLGTV